MSENDKIKPGFNLFLGFGLIIYCLVSFFTNPATFFFLQVDYLGGEAQIPASLALFFGYLLSVIGLKILADKRNPQNIFNRIILAENKLLKREKGRGRLSFIASFIIFLGVIAISYVVTRPSLETKLHQTWIMHELTYEGCPLEFGQLNINGINISFNGLTNSINFHSNNSLSLPGIESTSIQGQWKLMGDSLLIENTDNHNEIYGHKYAVKISNDTLSMNSKATVIKATRFF